LSLSLITFYSYNLYNTLHIVHALGSGAIFKYDILETAVPLLYYYCLDLSVRSCADQFSSDQLQVTVNLEWTLSS
jgi:hypothetical protein